MLIHDFRPNMIDMNFREWLILENQTIAQWLKANMQNLSARRQEAENSKLQFDPAYKNATPQQKKQMVDFIIYQHSQSGDQRDLRGFIYDMPESKFRFILNKLSGRQAGDMKSTGYDYQSNYDQWYKKDLSGRLNDQPKDVLVELDNIGMPGWKWVALNKSFCDIEKEAMGHCGNSYGSKTDNILSLRDPQGRPHLTFILGKGGIMGEMKGYSNRKPDSKYYPAIVALLKLPQIKSVKKGAGHPDEAHNNFTLDDLDPKTLADLKKLKPDIEYVASDWRDDPIYDDEGEEIDW